MSRRRNNSNKKIVTYEHFNTMDIVFVKIRGYAPWPSQIKEIFEDRLYFVSYFGPRWAEGEWVRRNTLSPIGPLENNPVVRKHARNNEFMEAWEYGRNLLELIKSAEEEELAAECNRNIPPADSRINDALEVNDIPHSKTAVSDSKTTMKRCAVVLKRIPLAEIFIDASQSQVDDIRHSKPDVNEPKATIEKCALVLKRIPLAGIFDGASQSQEDDVHSPKAVVREPNARNKRCAVLLKRNRENVTPEVDPNAATHTIKRMKRLATEAEDQSPPVKRVKRVLRNRKIIY